MHNAYVPESVNKYVQGAVTPLNPEQPFVQNYGSLTKKSNKMASPRPYPWS